MIVHIVDDEKFLNKTIEIFESIFPNQNYFLVGVEEGEGSYNKKEELIKLTSIEFVEINRKDYYEKFHHNVDQNTLVIFHNLYKTYKLKLIANIQAKIKIAWYFWGAELYGLNPKINNLLPLTQRVYFKNLPFWTYIKKKVFSQLKKQYYWDLFKKALKDKVDYTITNVTEDIDLLDEFTENNSKRGWFTYYSSDMNRELERGSSKKINILIGNSSSETNNHFDAFQLFNEKNIQGKKIYIPLSYGDNKYRELVIKEADFIFGEKAEPLVDFLSTKEYSKIIDSCSVLIMNHKRQQAYNTIMIAIANGCKVYLREENTIFKLLKREGFYVYSIQSDWSKSTEIEMLDIKIQEYNRELIRKLYSTNVVRSRIKAQVLEIFNE